MKRGSLVKLTSFLNTSFFKSDICVKIGLLYFKSIFIMYRSNSEWIPHNVYNILYRIWNYNDEAGFSQVLHLDVPRSVLPGSEAGILLVNGGLSLTSVLQRGPQSMAEYSRCVK